MSTKKAETYQIQREFLGTISVKVFLERMIRDHIKNNEEETSA